MTCRRIRISISDFRRSVLGVQLFFMISGFLMTFIHKDSGLTAAANFVRKRLIRIYPAYMIAFVPVVLIFHFMPSKGFAWRRDPVNIVRNFFFAAQPQPEHSGRFVDAGV